MIKALSKLTPGVVLTLALGGCRISQSAPQQLTQEACETVSNSVFIAGGEYVQGSDRPERDFAYRVSAQAISSTPEGIKRAEAYLRKSRWFDRENSRQSKTLPSFCLSRNLVTNQEYREFVQATGHRVPDISAEDYQVQGFLVHPYSKVQEFLWQDNQYPDGKEQHPVVLVSYPDVQAYAEWKTAQTGIKHRLPTAAEWEKAARGTQGNYFPWGNSWQQEATNAAPSKLHYTSAIASYPLSKSIYGAEDMAGNVFEYTSTLKWQGTRVVLKGCSWDDWPGFCRAAYQHTRPINSRHILFGFRLVVEPHL